MRIFSDQFGDLALAAEFPLSLCATSMPGAAPTPSVPYVDSVGVVDGVGLVTMRPRLSAPRSL